MALYNSGNVSGIVSNVVVGGFLCIGVVFFLIAATIVLSLISLYVPNHGEEGYGEQYQIKKLFLKALYQGSSFKFDNGIVADSVAVSNLCTSVYQSQGAENFFGCIAKNFRAFGPYNASRNSRRRRFSRAVDVGLYEIGEIDLYHSTSCGKKGDTLKYATSPSLSTCVKNRLKACNNLVNNSLTFTEWNILGTSLTQDIVDINGYGYQTIDVSKIFGIPFSIASSLASSLSLSNEIQNSILLGCQYIGPLPHANITAALAAQASETTTFLTTVIL